MEARTHIALVTIPVISHQVSILEFAKTLVNLYKNIFHVTCIIPTISNSLSISSKPFFDTLPSNIQCIYLPPTNFEDIIRNEVVLESQVQISVTRSMPLVRETLRSIISTSSNNMVALIVDAFAHEAHELAKELNILSYTYFPCSAMVLSMCLYSSKLDETITCEYKDHPQPIEIPGCISVNGTDLPDSVQERTNVAYKLFLHRSKQLRLADGIIINTFLEMESKALKAISQNGILYGTTPNVYPIGPIIQTRTTIQKNKSKCLLWLDNQPPNSVLFISFGSGGTLSHDQINELALGLEFSNYKFLWVNVRPPNNKATATYLSNEEVGPLHFLPLGFLQRTKGQGLVMCDWAPQVEVLKHNAIGAFLTHCGWNSILESIMHGVSMIAWPLFAEQRSNAALVTNSLKIALRPKCNSKGIVEKEEVANLIKGVMEGLESEEIRRRVIKLQKFANCAMMEDGSSMKTLSMLALKWMGLGRPIEN